MAIEKKIKQFSKTDNIFEIGIRNLIRNNILYIALHFLFYFKDMAVLSGNRTQGEPLYEYPLG